MTPSCELETIRCLLCQGVICFTPDDDARYKDHLHIEHRVFYFVSWIIEKTMEESRKEEEQSLSLLPSLTITPLIKQPVTPTSQKSAKKQDEDLMMNGQSQATTPTPPPPPKLKKFYKTEQLVTTSFPGGQDEDDEEEPSVSVIPVHPTFSDIGGVYTEQDNDTYHADYDAIEEDNGEYDEGSEDLVGGGGAMTPSPAADGLKEARIITIRVSGQRVGGRKMYKCSLCPNIKPWPTIHKAERHRITHIPLAFRKMFQCPQCKERFIKEKNVKRHLDSGLCQGPKDHPCVVCNEVFESKFDLQLHEENHVELLKRHRCHLCGAKFNKLKYLNKHIFSHSNYKPYKCDVCGKSFKSEYYVKTHRQAHVNAAERRMALGGGGVVGGGGGGGGSGGGGGGGSSSANEEYDEHSGLDFEEHLGIEPEVEMIEENPSDEESEPKTSSDILEPHLVCS